jgi:hypothetical protein
MARSRAAAELHWRQNAPGPMMTKQVSHRFAAATATCRAAAEPQAREDNKACWQSPSTDGSRKTRGVSRDGDPGKLIPTN